MLTTDYSHFHIYSLSRKISIVLPFRDHVWSGPIKNSDNFPGWEIILAQKSMSLILYCEKLMYGSFFLKVVQQARIQYCLHPVKIWWTIPHTTFFFFFDDLFYLDVSHNLQEKICLEGILHPNVLILLSFTHTHAVPDVRLSFFRWTRICSHWAMTAFDTWLEAMVNSLKILYFSENHFF